MRDWSRHFQAVSSTARFGGYLEDCQFGDEPAATAPPMSEGAQPFITPALLGVGAGIVAKLAGLLGPTPILIGAGVFGVGSLLNLSKAKTAEPLAASLSTTPTATPGYAPPVSRPSTTTTPFVGPVQQLPTSAPSKPWRVTARLTPGGFVMSVADVQDALNTLGFAHPYLVVDGKAGNQTTAAVKAAQAKYSLRQSGSTADGALKLALQKAMTDKAGFDKATAAADALAKSMGYT
jgi:hypothetical protein